MLNLVFRSTWAGVLGDSLELPSGGQATCHVRWRNRHESEANASELGLIWGSFGDMDLYSTCCAEICVPLDLGWCSRGISGVN